MTKPKEISNPFPGLRPFEANEYRLFFGREGQSDALIARLQRSHFLAVVGTSGSGKSSLVRAGLLPALRGGMMAGAGSGWRICIMRPGSDPIGNLALALAEEDVLLEAGAGLPPAEAEAVIEATLRRGALGLVDAVRQARLEPHEKLMVVVDQFEELFRFRAARVASSTGDDASAFVKLLLEAAQQSELPIYVVPTMRSDFLGDCAQFQGLPEAINEGQYLIPRMTRDERRFAITGPIGVTRGKVAEPLVNRLMNDVGDNPDQLPILQHALMRTWDYWSAHRRDGEPIGLEHYEAIGTMSEALSEHADEAFNELPDERNRLIAELLFKALTERGADNREIRRPTSLKDICAIANASPAEVGAVIDVFRGGGRSFLMPSAGVPLTPETVIDISHESLIRNWDRLQAWVKDEADSARIYRRLAGAATDYHQGAGGLLDDVTLQYVIKWQERSKPSWHWGVRYHSEYNTAMGYLEMSSRSRDARIEAEEERDRRELATAHAFADKQARSARRLRWLAAGMAVMFLISIGLAAFAVRAKWSAEKATRAAVEATRAAVDASTALQVSTGKLQTRTSELQDSIKDLKIAEEGRKQEAMRADDRAEAARKAEEQARIDADNAVKQAKVADAARKLAEANEKESKAAVERGDLMRRGLQALQRKQARDAQRAFGELADMLEPLQRGAANPPVGQRSLTPEQAVAELGWAYSRKGTAGWQAGELADAEQDFEKALESLDNEKADKKDPVLFETYDGVAHVYHEIASAGVLTNDMREDRKIDSKQYFKQAEEFYTKALEFHRASFTPNSRMIEPREIAEEYMNLARLYRDMGRIEDAESNYNSALESKLRLNTSDAAFAVLREQAEFYRTLNRLDKALEVYNRLIQLQEKRYGSLDEGRDLADSYNELGQMQAANGEATKAESAFSMADLIQRTALKLREKERFQQPNPTRWATLIGELVTVLDKLGDAYLRLEKFDAAESAYQKALDERKTDGKEMEKSWTKLSRLYLRMKDYAKAEEYNQRLVEFYQNKPRSLEYASALFQLGALYAEADRYADAESKYRAALVIYKERKSWSSEDLIHFRLSKIFEKQGRLKEREQALNDRVNSLQGYFDKVVVQTRPPNDLVAFVSEYLQAINGLGYFYDKTLDDKVKAAAAYQRAFAASQYITGKIYADKTLKFYALVLEDYRTLLVRLGNKDLATQVAVVAQSLTEKLNQNEERRQQNAVPVQQSSYEATPSAP